MNKYRILVVDDENTHLYSVKNFFREHDVIPFSDSSEALDSIKSGIKYDILLIDYKMPTISGRDFLVEAKKYLSSYKAVLITAFSDMEMLEDGLNNDLFDRVFRKPLNEALFPLVNNLILDLEKDRSEKDYQFILHKKITEVVNTFGQNQSIIIHSSKLMQNVIEIASKFSEYNSTVCIEGDSGVGKDVIAKYIHYKSSRSSKPFIIINCPAIPDNLFETEFFGYKKGAYTGAVSDKPGRFQLANEGTLFLDEIGDLPLHHQAKLLRVLEDNEVSSVGSIENDKVDVRIICATNKDLDELVNKGQFRSDLRYRLKVLTLKVPSLKERKEDIPLLATYFISEFANKKGKPCKFFDKEALEYLSNIEFPGNIRELNNLVEKLYVLTNERYISKNDIEMNICNKIENEKIENTLSTLSLTLEELEYRYILAQLIKYEYNLKNTAQVLGMMPNNLSRKLKTIGISLTSCK